MSAAVPRLRRFFALRDPGARVEQSARFAPTDTKVSTDTIV